MTCSRCQGQMTEAELVDPGETGLMWMKGWRCGGCDHDHNALHRHNCYFRQGTSQVVAMIASDEDKEPVPLGWETYPGLMHTTADQEHETDEVSA